MGPTAKKQRISKPSSDNNNDGSGSGIKLNASQMRQQNQLTTRQTALRNELLKTQRSQIAEIRINYQNQPTSNQEQQMKHIQELQTKHVHEQREQQQLSQKEMQDLQNLFKTQQASNQQQQQFVMNHPPSFIQQTNNNTGISLLTEQPSTTQLTS